MRPMYDKRGATVYCGDCIDIMKELPAESVDMLLADPPYSSGGAMRGDRNQSTNTKYVQRGCRELAEFEGDTRDPQSFYEWSRLWMTQARRLLRPGSIAGVWTDWRQMERTIIALQVAGFVYRGIVVWDKGPSTRPHFGRFKNQCEFFVWGTNGPRSIRGHSKAPPGVVYHPPLARQKIHAAQKPVKMLRDLLQVLEPGQTVLDPFAGAASVAVAAQLDAIKSISIEVSEGWIAACVERLEMADPTDNLSQAMGERSLFG